ncbi:hypothetical protein AGMMS50262_15110 [Bacteroidia bacterium]|nr:hypothetical protein AGMMS50262_15110 [Bacteroidia bacterium]
MSNIKLFESKQVRTTWSEAEEKWYFSVQDVVEVLTETVDAKDYIKKMKKRDPELAKGWGQIVPTLPIDTPGESVVSEENYLPKSQKSKSLSNNNLFIDKK